MRVNMFFTLVFTVLLSWPLLARSEVTKGWYWYEDEQVQEDTPAVQQKPQEIITEQRQRYDEALAAAVVNPTPENVRTYLEISKRINDQAGQFAKTFKEVIWQSPDLDRSISERPSDSQSLMVYQQQELRDKEQQLKRIAEQKGILYFFRSDCPYCDKFSPILKQFAATFGFTVIPITLDGKGSSTYPHPKTSHHMASSLNVSAVPATFLVKPSNNKVSAIAYGLSDWSSFGDKLLHASAQLESQTVSRRAP